MNGSVDESHRALLPVEVRASAKGNSTSVETWIDTAFDGHFVFPSNLIKELGLDTLVETEAILADGSSVVLQTYICFVDWFGAAIAAQVVENDGRFPLLGTALLANQNLAINYRDKTVVLS